MSRWTTRLFAIPSALSGAARVFDMGATFDSWNESPTVTEADRAALTADFHAVGDDLRIAMAEVANSTASA